MRGGKQILQASQVPILNYLMSLHCSSLPSPLFSFGNDVTFAYKIPFFALSSTYDHRVWRTGLPVRSAVLKPHAGELVVRWVTTSESSLLYVFVFASIYNFYESVVGGVQTFREYHRRATLLWRGHRLVFLM